MYKTKMEQQKKKKAEMSKLVNEQVNDYLAKSGYTKEELALMLGISLASLYNKLKDVDKFTFYEFRELCSILELKDELKLALIA